MSDYPPPPPPPQPQYPQVPGHTPAGAIPPPGGGYPNPPGSYGPPPGYGPPGNGYGPPPGPYGPPGGGGYGQKPSNYLVLAIFSILCCWPVAIAAIVFSAKVDKLWYSGQHAAALDASNKAKIFAIVSIALGLVGTLFWLLVGGSSLEMDTASMIGHSG